MLTCLHVYMLTFLQFYYSPGYMLVCMNVGMIHAYRQRAQFLCGEFSTSDYRHQAQLRPKVTMTSLNQYGQLDKASVGKNPQPQVIANAKSFVYRHLNHESPSTASSRTSNSSVDATRAFSMPSVMWSVLPNERW